MKPVIDMDLDLLIVRTIWANFNHERSLRTMETFAREVMPYLREEAERAREAR
jgi:hypothetical protein